MKKRRVLVVSRLFGRDKSFWITDDLVRSLTEEGAEVDIFFYDMANTGHPKHLVGIAKTIHYCPYTSPQVSKLGFLVKHIHMLARLARVLSQQGSYYAVISHTALAISSPVLSIYSRLTSARYVAIVWDFYPDQWLETGSIGAGKARMFKLAEDYEFRSIDQAIVPTSDNGRYMVDRHRGFSGEIAEVPIWRDARSLKVPIRKTEDTERDALRVIFGGTLQPGRDYLGLLEAMTILNTSHPNVELYMVGGGISTTGFLDEASNRGIRNVTAVPRLPTDDYLQMVVNCDIGLVLLDATTSVPSFPSKTLDYMACGLPVVAAVDPSSDFAHLLSDEFRCGLVCSPGDGPALAQTILAALDQRSTLGPQAERAFVERLDPRIAAQEILRSMTGKDA